jgi:hypothetical protein
LRLRTPPGWLLRSAESSGTVLRIRAKDETIDLSTLRGKVHIVATFTRGDAK